MNACKLKNLPIFQQNQNLSIVPIFSYSIDERAEGIFQTCLAWIQAIWEWFQAALVKVSPLLPAHNPELWGITDKDELNMLRWQILSTESDDWAVERVGIAVDGVTIDAYLKRQKGKDHKRWALFACGNGEFAEVGPARNDFQQLLQQTSSHGIFFNYPGVGESRGRPSPRGLQKAYRAMLAFLETHVGAKEIFSFSHSLGGGVEDDALASHALRKDIQYLFIRSRTFSTLDEVVQSILHTALSMAIPLRLAEIAADIAAWVIRVMGWNLGSSQSWKRVQAPQIVLQNSTDRSFINMHEKRQSAIKNDRVIPSTESLGYAVLKQKNFIEGVAIQVYGIPESHNEELAKKTVESLAEAINLRFQTR